jgi:hypothetical protein
VVTEQLAFEFDLDATVRTLADQIRRASKDVRLTGPERLLMALARHGLDESALVPAAALVLALDLLALEEQNRGGPSRELAVARQAAWLDKRGLAEYLSCSVRSVESAVAEGCPHAIIFGRVKFRAPEVEAWLEQAGHLERRGNQVDDVNVDNRVDTALTE